MIISCENVGKSYDRIKALDGLSLEIPKGIIFGLLGPNGAGKTTFINILSSLVRHDTGTIRVMDRRIPEDFSVLKKDMGFVPQDLAIYNDLTAYENVSFFASLYGLRGKEKKEKVERVLEFTGLQERKNDLVKTYSGGMKRRLNIACGICHEPKLIFLDEPTVGIDPQSRNYILEAIKELNKKGNTVVYTTHYMEEAQELCHRIAIIDMGKIIAQGTLDELRKLVSEHELLTIDLRKTGNTDPGDMARIPGVISVSMTDNQLHIIHDGNRDMMEHVVTYITGKNAGIVKMESRKPNLEDVFLSLTGKVLRD